MPTVALETNAPRHRKVCGLSDSAFRLWISATCHARDQGSDGELTSIDLDAIPRCPKGKRRVTVVGELVASGLWTTVENGWQIHDYSDWNETREEVQGRRRKARERMAKLRGSSREHDANFARSSGDVRDRGSLTPDHHSSPDPEGGAGGDEDRKTICPVAVDLPPVVVSELAAGYSVSEATIARAIEEFRTYWVLGAGAGKKRDHWHARLRDDLKRKHETGRLDDYERENPRPSNPKREEASRKLAASFAAADEARRRELAEGASLPKSLVELSKKIG